MNECQCCVSGTQQIWSRLFPNQWLTGCKTCRDLATWKIVIIKICLFFWRLLDHDSSKWILNKLAQCAPLDVCHTDFDLRRQFWMNCISYMQNPWKISHTIFPILAQFVDLFEIAEGEVEWGDGKMCYRTQDFIFYGYIFSCRWFVVWSRAELVATQRQS